MITIDAIELYSSGVALEPIGDTYLFNGHTTFEIWVNVPRPAKQFKQLQFNNCLCFSMLSDDVKYDSDNCTNHVKDMFQTQLDLSWNQSLQFIEEHMENTGYRGRRDMSGLSNGLSLIFDLIDFGWNIKQDYQITQLKKVTMKNAESIGLLAEALKTTQEIISIQINHVYEDMKHLDQKICQTAEMLWGMEMETKAEMVMQSFWLSVEQQAAALMKGNIPYTLEYINIFLGACRNTCSALTAKSCRKYCRKLLQDLPPNYSPTLLGVYPNHDSVYISFAIELPVLTVEPRPLMSINTFGVIVTDDGETFKRSPVLNNFAVDITPNTTLELDDSSCESNRKNLICPTSAIDFNSCLNNFGFCRFRQIPTERTCTYQELTRGVAIFAEKPVSVKNPIKIYEVGHEQPEWTGVKFVQSEEQELIVDCYGNRITIPAHNDVIKINVTIRSFDVNFQDFEFNQEVFQIVEIERHFEDDLEKIRQNSIDVLELNSNNWWMIIGFIAALTLGAAIATTVFCYISKRQQSFSRELNMFRPIME